jgi:Asp-tRNA(Asn)/Glu-tRNA(Gln) amidotransferase C subunit
MVTSMMIEELRVTAQLARLKLGDDELAAALPAFEQMVEYFAVMQAADDELFDKQDNSTIEAVHPELYATYTQLRPDELATTPGNRQQADALVSKAKERDDKFIVIPNVL